MTRPEVASCHANGWNQFLLDAKTPDLCDNAIATDSGSIMQIVFWKSESKGSSNFSDIRKMFHVAVIEQTRNYSHVTSEC